MSKKAYIHITKYYLYDWHGAISSKSLSHDGFQKWAKDKNAVKKRPGNPKIQLKIYYYTAHTKKNL